VTSPPPPSDADDVPPSSPPSSLDPTVQPVEGTSDSPPSTSTPHPNYGGFITEEVTVGSGTGFDEKTVQRDLASVEAVERAEADALLKWCEKPALPVPTSVWHPEDDVLLVAGVGTFPTGEARRWRSIAAMVPGKNAAQCQSRTRNDDFIKAHIFSGEKKGKPDSKLPLGPMTRDGDTDARLAELIIAFTILDGNCDCDDDFTLEPPAADAPLMPSHCPLTLNPADSCADEQWLKVPTPRLPPDCDGTTHITASLNYLTYVNPPVSA
jgi:hypothetical protein